jgi:hypothetical protein
MATNCTTIVYHMHEWCVQRRGNKLEGVLQSQPFNATEGIGKPPGGLRQQPDLQPTSGSLQELANDTNTTRANADPCPDPDGLVVRG